MENLLGMMAGCSLREDEACMKIVLRNVAEWLRSVHDFEQESTIKAADAIKTQQKLRPWGRQDRYTGVNYDDPIICSGYLHRYAFCHAALARHVTRAVLIEEPNGDLAKSLKNEKCLKIVSAGGGPGNDLMGFCSAMKDFATQLDELHMTVIDLKGGWKDCFHKVMTEVQIGGSYGKLGEFFVQQDLCNGVPPELREADFVLMVKDLSNVSNIQKISILTNIFLSMKQGALFLYIDIDSISVVIQGLYTNTMNQVYRKCQQKFSPSVVAVMGQSSYDICIMKKY